MSQPDHFTQSGLTAATQGNHQQALDLFLQALQVDPNNSEALYGCCVALKALNRHGPVLGYANRLFQAGFAHTQASRPQAALACFEKVIALGLGSTQVYLNCGLLLRTLERRDEALAYLEKACALTPRDLHSTLVHALLLQELRRHREALAVYRHATELEPDNFPGNFNQYASYLTLGEFTAGWEKFDWRWRNTANRQFAPDFADRLWTGQALPGKTLLLYAEHGQGDAIQFCRLTQAVAERGARVVLVVHHSLKNLLQGLAGVHQLIGQGETVPSYDYHCPLMSLPRILGITLDTIPATLPYLRADASKVQDWARRMGPACQALRVGLTWAGEARPGSDEVEMNQRRSMTFARLTPLLDLPGIEFYSVQKGEAAQNQLSLSPYKHRVIDLSAGFSDFAETAALLENLDLLISVDTAVVHLAGALGKPVWLLNRFDTCWRWLLERNDSPWYPGVMRIFRQPTAGDWDTVVAETKQALHLLSQSHGCGAPPSGR